MQPNQQDRLVVILVRARNPANIGAVARAMHDLGYAHLRIVNEFHVPFEAAKSAVDASSVLEAAREYATVAEATADCTFVYGTTAVGERVLQHPLHILPEATGRIADVLSGDPAGRVALLFGSEKTGLTNDELSHCHALLTIPMNTRTAHLHPGRHLSMNLGQAVAVCLYAIAQQAAVDTPAVVETKASAADNDRLLGMLREVLDRAGYTRRNPANAREANLRRLILRMGLSVTDAPVWTGMLRQLMRVLPRTSDAGEDSSNEMD
ncbi:tRNA/rRNA methyltransferase [Granulicella rosea]|uniref:tRNA/rRNA methyltransferase n=1 Tax=Granulicella rosea TaxID=474952 RepID=A0A239DCN8_9BACT|nr:TrmH family RNA methyltransferase [Granulicella rosea]SNS29822.1 tRNA/rRNA methyltransferase [Granulicella rosea]